jgi:activator of HSP90 ATPase
MSKVISQTVTFPGAGAKQLYNLYMNSKQHSQVTGAAAEISKKVGEAWQAYDGHARGKNLLVSANKMIVQTWRAKNWDRKTPDSILVLSFSDVEGGAQVELAHSLVPESDFKEIKKGWNDFYWKKWKAHLK